jgi:hypothetical protein
MTLLDSNQSCPPNIPSLQGLIFALARIDMTGEDVHSKMRLLPGIDRWTIQIPVLLPLNFTTRSL